MLNLAIFLLIVALAFAVLGFTGIAASFAGVAKILFVVFLVLFLISAVTGSIRRPS
ncbi:DUF1328 domain-containing protein [Symmachiella dynata]|jgi:uncharacterized membrane protein YtjA (UPF0391 family)|uniref:Uncharacterized protein n=1 Tax=Symmachiella dynata TaxID=2527995 RepID=A0A517ZUN3_9PLAN|nr:DUF1328 family protein [Symmachiella dynata]QDT50451.1 hypothetical protein Pan258_45100 [Symmachiella dynata]QDU46170.1 hypothetical protein Mal52_46690 [Symmachiella dynata]|tara:strand:- start:637 stop:804 length:168 start_codon:yes stop_codon:yes gene_type:complete